MYTLIVTKRNKKLGGFYGFIIKKNLTEIVFIMDRSGSMSGLKQDTIGGFNSLIEKQKKEDSDEVISTVLFDHQRVFYALFSESGFDEKIIVVAENESNLQFYDLD